MPLKNYILNGPSVVILDDDRDPHVSWRNHLARTQGLRGGVDLVAKVGTPIYAPTDGVMDWRKNDGSAGNSCRFVHDDNKGWKDVFSHLSWYVGKDMQHFNQGELIAYSGNSGGVTQHLHRHLLDPNDVRQNPWDHFTPTSAPAGGTATLLATPIAQEDDMTTFELIREDGKAEVYFAVNRLQRYHVPDKDTLDDYEFFIANLPATNHPANPKVQVVKNIRAFGAIVK